MQRATPASTKPLHRDLAPMPRQVREAPPKRPAARGRVTFLGRPWPLPISPLTVALTLLFVVAALGVWLYEGRYETPPAEAAKALIPYKADDVKSATLTTPDGSVTFKLDPSGKLTPGGTPAVATATPPPEATPGPVVLAPATKLNGLIGQLHDLTIDREVVNQPSTSPDFGLDKPQLTLTLEPRQGITSTIAVGSLNPDQTAYYVRREDKKDTVLASRYTLDDLLKTASDLVKTS